MAIENTPTITNDQRVNDMRGAIEHRATWMYLLLDEMRKAGVDWEAVGRKAILRCGSFHGKTKFTQTEDLRVLDDKILPGLWYPLACYRRMTELLWEIEGKQEPAYLLARGARAAERLFEAGLYQQMRRGEEMGAEKRERSEGWTEFDGNLMTSLAGAIFNVSRWRYRRHPEDPNVNRIEVSEAAELPEVSRLAVAGLHRVHGLAWKILNFGSKSAAKLSMGRVMEFFPQGRADSYKFVECSEGVVKWRLI